MCVGCGGVVTLGGFHRPPRRLARANREHMMEHACLFGVTRGLSGRDACVEQLVVRCDEQTSIIPFQENLSEKSIVGCAPFGLFTQKTQVELSRPSPTDVAAFRLGVSSLRVPVYASTSECGINQDTGECFALCTQVDPAAHARSRARSRQHSSYINYSGGKLGRKNDVSRQALLDALPRCPKTAHSVPMCTYVDAACVLHGGRLRPQHGLRGEDLPG